MVINLSAMLLLKVSLYLILFVTVPLHYIDYIRTWYDICSIWFLDIKMSTFLVLCAAIHQNFVPPKFCVIQYIK